MEKRGIFTYGHKECTLHQTLIISDKLLSRNWRTEKCREFLEKGCDKYPRDVNIRQAPRYYLNTNKPEDALKILSELIKVSSPPRELEDIGYYVATA